MVQKWRRQPVQIKRVFLTTLCRHQLRVHYIQELVQGLQKIAARQRKHLPDGMKSSFLEGWYSWHGDNRRWQIIPDADKMGKMSIYMLLWWVMESGT